MPNRKKLSKKIEIAENNWNFKCVWKFLSSSEEFSDMVNYWIFHEWTSPILSTLSNILKSFFFSTFADPNQGTVCNNWVELIFLVNQFTRAVKHKNNYNTSTSQLSDIRHQLHEVSIESTQKVHSSSCWIRLVLSEQVDRTVWNLANHFGLLLSLAS